MFLLVQENAHLSATENMISNFYEEVEIFKGIIYFNLSDILLNIVYILYFSGVPVSQLSSIQFPQKK